MASITKRYRTKNGAKIFDAWDIRTSKLTGKEVAYHCPATRYNESDAQKRREIIEEVEKAYLKGKAASSETVDEIRTLDDRDFLEWLTKYGIVAPVKVLSFEGLQEKALEGFSQRGTKPQTIALIKYNSSFFGEYLKEKGLEIPVASIDKTIARDFWEWLKTQSIIREWGTATLNLHLQHIKQVFKWGVKHLDEMTSNPFDCIDKIVDTTERKKEYLSETQAQTILEALEHYNNPRMWTTFFLLGYRQGLRVWSEAPLLRWGWFDLEGRRMMIDDVKRSKLGAKKTREMILDDKTAEYLKRLRDYRRANGEPTREQDYIFPELWKIPGVACFAGAVIAKKFQRILDRLGIEITCNVGTMRRAAQNDWDNLVGEHWTNIFLGHSQETARKHYQTEIFTRNVLDRYDQKKKERKAKTEQTTAEVE